jgi:hypothetical protein
MAWLKPGTLKKITGSFGTGQNEDVPDLAQRRMRPFTRRPRGGVFA